MSKKRQRLQKERLGANYHCGKGLVRKRTWQDFPPKLRTGALSAFETCRVPLARANEPGRGERATRQAVRIAELGRTETVICGRNRLCAGDDPDGRSPQSRMRMQCQRGGSFPASS